MNNNKPIKRIIVSDELEKELETMYTNPSEYDQYYKVMNQVQSDVLNKKLPVDYKEIKQSKSISKVQSLDQLLYSTLKEKDQLKIDAMVDNSYLARFKSFIRRTLFNISNLFKNLAQSKYLY